MAKYVSHPEEKKNKENGIWDNGTCFFFGILRKMELHSFSYEFSIWTQYPFTNATIKATMLPENPFETWKWNSVCVKRVLSFKLTIFTCTLFIQAVPGMTFPYNKLFHYIPFFSAIRIVDVVCCNTHPIEIFILHSECFNYRPTQNKQSWST